MATAAATIAGHPEQPHPDTADNFERVHAAVAELHNDFLEAIHALHDKIDALLERPASVPPPVSAAVSSTYVSAPVSSSMVPHGGTIAEASVLTGGTVEPVVVPSVSSLGTE